MSSLSGKRGFIETLNWGRTLSGELMENREDRAEQVLQAPVFRHSREECDRGLKFRHIGYFENGVKNRFILRRFGEESVQDVEKRMDVVDVIGRPQVSESGD